MRKSFLFLAFIISTILVVFTVQASDKETLSGWLADFSRTKGVKPVTNDSYQEECGSCHFAFPPGLLPAASWEKLLEPAALEDHFEENAELDAEILDPLREYVLQNSADKSFYKRSRKIEYATRGKVAPLRITEVSYIRRKHHEIPKDMISGNKDVVSLSNCSACHTDAEQGRFDDDLVNIPNYGPWDD